MTEQKWDVTLATRHETKTGYAQICEGGVLAFTNSLFESPHTLYARHAWVKAERIETPKESTDA